MPRFPCSISLFIGSLGLALSFSVYCAGPSEMAGAAGRRGPNPSDVYPIVVPYADCSSSNCNNYNQPLTPITVPTGPNGATQTQVGTTTYYTPGGSSVTNGNQTIYSNGTNCVVNGNQKICN